MSDFPYFKKFSLYDEPSPWVERYNSTTATNTTLPDLSKIKIERRMETAREIFDKTVGKHHRELSPLNYEKTMEFAKEIAEKACRAGFNMSTERFNGESEDYGFTDKSDVDAAIADVMKQLFPE